MIPLGFGTDYFSLYTGYKSRNTRGGGEKDLTGWDDALVDLGFSCMLRGNTNNNLSVAWLAFSG